MDNSVVILLAAGRGTRMGIKENKCLLPLKGRSVLLYSLSAFKRAGVGSAVVVAAEDELDACRAIVRASDYPRARVVAGGATRQQSVWAGVQALIDTVQIVLIHDGARPFVSEQIIQECVKSVRIYGTALTAIPATDTIKVVQQGQVQQTLDRSILYCAQTPQAFERGILERAHAYARETGFEGTDDASLVEHLGEAVHVVPGDAGNIKLTTPQDIHAAYALLRSKEEDIVPEESMRIGHGYDVHALVPGRKLILGGVDIPYEKGLAGHSDADALTHALMDALLGAAGLGDIGAHFPDTDAQYKAADSLELLKAVIERVEQRGYACANCDVTVVLQRPKVAPYIEAMRENLSAALGIPVQRVSVKATTTEGLGFEGAGEGVSAHAVALIGPLDKHAT